MELPLREVEQTFARVSLTIRMMPNYPRENLLELITVLHLLRLRDRQVVDSFLAGTTGAVELIRSFEEMAATVRESRFGLWVEAQARWASLKEGELDEWVRSMDQRIEQGDSKLEDDEREVREMLKHVRKGTILYSGGSPLPSVRRTFQLTSQFAFPTMTDDADSSEEGSAAS
jgi:hypothetical protein